jgi:hypothetical protein
VFAFLLLAVPLELCELALLVFHDSGRQPPLLVCEMVRRGGRCI